MSIIRENGDESQPRVERMIEEFRKAQSRRLVKAAAVKSDVQVLEFQRDARDPVAVASTTTPTSRSNG